MDSNLSFSKIVASPTFTSWSQAYSAGKLFAVLSLEKNINQSDDLISLNVAGKDLLDRLEKEFFATTTKDLESIKNAISTTFVELKENVNISFVLGFINNNILYLFIKGAGKVSIKRDGKLGNILIGTKDDQKNILSASGFLKDNDLIILQSHSFSEIIDNETLYSSLESNSPQDTQDLLAPSIHKAENGGACAIIIKYKALETQSQTSSLSLEENESNINSTEIKTQINKEYLVNLINKFLSFFKAKLKSFTLKLTPKKAVFLIAFVLIAILLLTNIFTSIKKQNEAKISALFSEIYPLAQKEYEEGESLMDLNSNIALDSFLASQKILQDNKDKFPDNSEEKEKINDLLNKISNKLSSVSSGKSLVNKRSSLSIEVLNGSGVAGEAAKASDILKKLGYKNILVGNADNTNYQNVSIQVKKSKEDTLNILRADLSKNYTIGETSSNLSESSTEDALVIIGK